MIMIYAGASSPGVIANYVKSVMCTTTTAALSGLSMVVACQRGEGGGAFNRSGKANPIWISCFILSLSLLYSFHVLNLTICIQH